MKLSQNIKWTIANSCGFKHIKCVWRYDTNDKNDKYIWNLDRFDLKWNLRYHLVWWLCCSYVAYVYEFIIIISQLHEHGLNIMKLRNCFVEFWATKSFDKQKKIIVSLFYCISLFPSLLQVLPIAIQVVLLTNGKFVWIPYANKTYKFRYTDPT